jgi:D-alanyl-D-alanine dipeptidase
VSRRALVVAAVAAGRRLLAGRISGAGLTGRQRAGEWWHLYYYVTGATLLDELIR